MAKNRTLKSQARSNLTERHQTRGHHHSNLWFYYSPKTRKNWCVSSDLEFEHAILLEALSDVIRFDLTPEPLIVKVGQDDHMTQFDAIVWHRDSGPTAREVKPLAEELHPTQVRTIHQRQAQEIAAESIGATRLVVTEKVLGEHKILISNWIRVVATMAAMRDVPMAKFRQSASIVIQHHEHCALERLALERTPADATGVIAAAFQMLQEGLLESNLDKEPLSLNSKIWLAGART